MNDNGKNYVPSPEEQEKINNRLNQLHNLTLKQREWIVIYNILVSLQYKLGDAKIVNDICDKIQPIVAIDSSIPPTKGNPPVDKLEEPKKDVILD